MAVRMTDEGASATRRSADHSSVTNMGKSMTQSSAAMSPLTPATVACSSAAGAAGT